MWTKILGTSGDSVAFTIAQVILNQIKALFDKSTKS